MHPLLGQVQQADPVWYVDVYEIIMQVWRQYLPLAESDELLGLIQWLLHEMEIDEAIISDFHHLLNQ